MDAVIVTGAAGALGHAVVDEFLAGGRAVVALDRPSERLDALPVRPDALVGLAGGFTPGKLADVTVFSKDLLTIPEDQIPSAQVLYTIVGGKVQYTASR